jgi:hypothetical protein
MSESSREEQERLLANYWEVPRPDWERWARTTQLPLWQAVALLADIEPDHLALSPGSNELHPMSMNAPLAYHELMRLAESALGGGTALQPVLVRPGRLKDSTVELANFAVWAVAAKIPLPEGFPSPTAAQAITHAGWPWGRYETELLRSLASVAEALWKRYDPTDPSSAPTNQQVIDWLMARKVNETNAKAIATILRADGLPMGPRKGVGRKN